MKFHLVTSTKFDFKMFVQRSQKDQGPRHTLYQVSQYLNAEIHQPDPSAATFFDKMLSNIAGQPQHWALARQLIQKLGKGDVVYCAGEDIGLPLATLSKLKPEEKRPLLSMSVMAPNRLRVRQLLKQLKLAEIVQLFTVTDQNKANSLKELLDLSPAQVYVLPEQTDAQFFTPALGSLRGSRPLIASAGLEQRDYVTLASAISGRDVDVKVCACSPNASTRTQKAIPEALPANMEMRYFEFYELRDLYRSADVVVISLLRNEYSAGLTVLMEAMACNRPVIMTRNIGLSNELIEKGIVIGVEPGDSEGLWKEIERLISNPQEAEDLAQKAYDYFLAHHTSEQYVEELSQRLRAIAPLSSKP
jgi:glycosyltransferase involved in cell wall biosynthesis